MHLPASDLLVSEQPVHDRSSHFQAKSEREANAAALRMHSQWSAEIRDLMRRDVRDFASELDAVPIEQRQSHFNAWLGTQRAMPVAAAVAAADSRLNLTGGNGERQEASPGALNRLWDRVISTPAQALDDVSLHLDLTWFPETERKGRLEQLVERARPLYRDRSKVPPVSAFSVFREMSESDQIRLPALTPLWIARAQVCLLPEADQQPMRERIGRIEDPFLLAWMKRFPRSDTDLDDHVYMDKFVGYIPAWPEQVSYVAGATYALTLREHGARPSNGAPRSLPEIMTLLRGYEVPAARHGPLQSCGCVIV